jgi:hypothetical protein
MRRPPARIVAAAAAVVVLVGLVTALLTVVLAGTAAGPLAAEPELAPDRRPCLAPTDISQSHTGRIDGCVQVGVLRAGRYNVSLQQPLVVVPAMRRPVHDGQTARLQLSPSAGPPGTTIQLRGELPSPVPAGQRRALMAQGSDLLGFVDWNGAGGLMLDAAHFRWTSARSFVAVLHVPRAPWIQLDGHPRVLGLRSAPVPITFTCMRGRAQCGGVPDGIADFELTVDRRNRWCLHTRSCATLAVYPRRAPAGALVRVSGYAPLTQFYDAGNAFFGRLQITRARAVARPVLSLSRGAGQTVAERDGSAPLVVLGGPAFASLGAIRPQSVVASGQTEIAPDPANQKIVGWCATGVIDVSVHGRIEHVSTAPVAAVLRGLGGLAREGQPMPLSCVDVMPLSATTVLAAFSGALPQFKGGIPPIVFYAVETRDRGRTWTPLPVPPGTVPSDFGGFRADGRNAEAVYARGGPRFGSVEAAHPVAERSGDQGRSWTAARLSCGRHGPCETFGPFLPGNCAQGLSTQLVLRSDDGGRSWRSSPILHSNPFACGDAQLASIGGGRELLVNAISVYPLELSSDGGASWSNLDMPVPARLENAGNQLQDFGPGGVTLLPDGGLLLTGGGAYSGGWHLLRPGARRWCDVAGKHGTWQFQWQGSRITQIGRRLWWLTDGHPRRHGRTPTLVHELPLSAIRCA